MSSGALPPVPDLIPIALLKGCRREDPEEVMGEQRSRRTGSQPSADLIDSAQSRGPSAAPQPPQSRKVRPERHRKSDRRREHRKSVRTRSTSKQSSKSRETPSPERPVNPRVNPIFVWVRQEDTRIVDVKCEDYDKRNRILLTKTAQGWRAIPRTETLSLSQEDSSRQQQQQQQHHHHHHHQQQQQHHHQQDQQQQQQQRQQHDHHHHHHHHNNHHHHRNRKSRKTKIRRRSAAVQVDSDLQDQDTDEQGCSSPTWTSPVNVESHLPSHKVPKKCPSPERSVNSPSSNINSAIKSAQTQPEKCNAAKVCDVASPLDNLLAVAEFEFNQHMQTNEWNNQETDNTSLDKTFAEIDDDQKEFINNMEQLNNLIDSCSNTDQKTNDGTKTEDCDYNDEDDNNLAMDDILSRLEQSLRSPECPEIECETNFETKIEDIKDCFPIDDIDESNFKSVPELEGYFNQEDEPKSDEIETPKPESTLNDDEPTDLSIKAKYNNDNNNCDDVELLPTDLSVPKSTSSSSPQPQPLSLSLSPSPSPSPSPRPPSQNSETIQSPQPSGIPAVPPSPDIVTTSANYTKTKSVFLESLLTTSKSAQNSSEVTIVRQKEPLDLGKCRKSASPTVTCSEEEVKNKSELEPPTKKFKSQDITLKHLLDIEARSKTDADANSKPQEKNNETPRLLELLKTDSEPDPLTQLRQTLCDTTLNVPDPMLVPKERLSKIISHPGREIPRLLKQRPELRLPEALAFPHLLQDPDILVITLQQLETIILKQNQSLNLKDVTSIVGKERPEKSKRQEREVHKEAAHAKKKHEDNSVKIGNHDHTKSGNFNELASDIDAATTAAFNQMMWLPYLNQLETMSFGNNADVMKLISNSMSMFPGQVHNLNHLMGANRLPPPVTFPFQQPPINYNNPLEVSMWQEAMIQANMLRPKNPFDTLNSKQSFRDYLDKMNFTASSKKPTVKHMVNKNLTSNLYPTNNSHNLYQNAFLNIPNSYQNHKQQMLQNPTYNNALYSTKNLANHHKSTQQPYLPHFDASKANFANFYHQHQRLDDKKMPDINHQKPKLSCKPFASLEKPPDFGKHYQPIDLSGSTTPSSKLKVKQHLIDPNAKLLKHDDVPEVGSTTASIEEMQDAHKHLWHPLFGNQKGYNNPWNWTTVTATGE